jgi:hypothetical protein
MAWEWWALPPLVPTPHLSRVSAVPGRCGGVCGGGAGAAPVQLQGGCGGSCVGSCGGEAGRAGAVAGGVGERGARLLKASARSGSSITALTKDEPSASTHPEPSGSPR